MKTNKKINTLTLNKRTISRLTENEQRNAKGGNVLSVVETRDCILIPIDYTIFDPTTVYEPDPEPWKTIVISQIG